MNNAYWPCCMKVKFYVIIHQNLILFVSYFYCSIHFLWRGVFNLHEHVVLFYCCQYWVRNYGNEYEIVWVAIFFPIECRENFILPSWLEQFQNYSWTLGNAHSLKTGHPKRIMIQCTSYKELISKNPSNLAKVVGAFSPYTTINFGIALTLWCNVYVPWCIRLVSNRLDYFKGWSEYRLCLDLSNVMKMHAKCKG